MTATLKQLSRLLRDKEISSVQLTRKYIEVIENRDPQINSYVTRCFDEALLAAERADKMIARGEAAPLTGIPFALKDNICTDGIETTCCSKILSGFKPYYDATAYKKLKDICAPLLGKTNMDEFAMGSTSETSCFGAPKNPRDLNRVTGGSSGGSAAAVAAGLAPFALGSDTGGSVRQPAAFCGVVGFKPTYGAVSRYGLIAYGSSLDQIGAIALSVEDAAIVFNAVKGEDERDMTSRKCPDIGELTGDIKGMKVGVVSEFFEGLSPEIKGAVERALKGLESCGATICEYSAPSLKSALPVYYIIACAEASSNLGRYDGIRYGFRAQNYSSVDDMIIKTRTQGFGKEVQKRIMLGTYVLSGGYLDAYYKKACLLRESIKEDFNELFERCDILVAPTAPNTAFPLGYTQNNAVEMYLSDMCTVPVNIAGLPAVSLPCGSDKSGLPIGVQIIGSPFNDSTTLNAAHALELCGVSKCKPEKGGVEL